MSRARQKAVTVRFSDEEWAELEDLCELHGLNKNAAVRAGVHALRGYGPPQRVLVLDDGFTEAVRQLRLVGNNLNQIARQLNAQAKAGAPIDAELMKRVYDTHRLVVEKGGNVLLSIRSKVTSTGGLS